MRLTGIIWLEEIVDKLWSKHNVSQEEVEELLAARAHYRFVERGIREGEDVYAAMGRATSGRYLIVFFVYKDDGRALVVSARDMTQSERKRYGKR